MKAEEKLCGIYYSDYVIENRESLATFCLYFDEVQLMPSFTVRMGQPIFFQFPHSSEFACRISPFLECNQQLLDAMILRHQKSLNLCPEPSQFEEDLTQIIKLLPGRAQFTSIIRVYVAKVLSQRQGLIPVGDKPELPFPETAKEISRSVKGLSYLLAQQCIKLVLPQCRPIQAEDILEARAKLRNELIPFRMAMHQLAYKLRTELLSSDASLDEITKEVNFLVEASVQPQLYELHRKIKTLRGKLWLRVFGKILVPCSWIWQIAKNPSFDNLAKLPEMFSKSIEDYLLVTGENGILIPSGLSFLLKLDDAFKNPKESIADGQEVGQIWRRESRPGG